MLSPGSMQVVHTTESVAPDAFFGGVLDFRAEGRLRLDVFAARNPATIDPGRLRPMGYITREYSGTHRESRVYKGSSPVSATALRADWGFADADAGVLPACVPRFDRTRRAYLPPEEPTRDGWLSHITIGHRAEAVQSDMVAFRDPTWPRPFRPDAPSDALGLIPNFGNWAVVYHHHGELRNEGTRARRVVFRLMGQGLHLACQPSPAHSWVRHHLPGPGPLDWADFAVDAGQTLAYSARWVLGGPSNGCVRQQVILLP